MTVLCFGAHMDDVEPQMGGTIAAISVRGHRVVIVTASRPLEESTRRLREAERAAAHLGADFVNLDIDPMALRHVRSLVEVFDRVFAEYEPERVYTCWDGDSHQDHVAVSKLVGSAARRSDVALFQYQPIIPCGLTGTAFYGDTYVDITQTLERKLESIRHYTSQVKKYKGWLEAVRGRDAHNGFRVGVPYAESFRTIVRLDALPGVSDGE